MEKNDVLICWQIWPNAFCENELVILLEKRLEKRPTQQGTSEEQAGINAHCQFSKFLNLDYLKKVSIILGTRYL